MTDMTVNVTPERLKKAIATAEKKFAATLDPSRRAILDETIKTLKASLAAMHEAPPTKGHAGPCQPAKRRKSATGTISKVHTQGLDPAMRIIGGSAAGLSACQGPCASPGTRHAGERNQPRRLPR